MTDGERDVLVARVGRAARGIAYAAGFVAAVAYVLLMMLLASGCVPPPRHYRYLVNGEWREITADFYRIQGHGGGGLACVEFVEDSWTEPRAIFTCGVGEIRRVP